MARPFNYTDQQLRDAIEASVSWRGALRHLGLRATSAAAIRSVRARADRIGIGYEHFDRQRGWGEDEFRVALARAASWDDVVAELGQGTLLGDAPSLRAHAARLGIDVSHLDGMPEPFGPNRELVPDLANLSRSGPLLAAAWFTLCGKEVSWPLEPARYDLAVRGDEGFRRVQVKTTTVRVGNSWKVYLSTTGRRRRTYGLDEIDDFFVVDGDLDFYVLPIEKVGGLQAVHLGAYSGYRVPRLVRAFL
ncbi:group I intron-associated PD-(D/E)XK endonuclease [Microbacterium xylanilyticum]